MTPEGPCSWPFVECECSALDNLSPGELEDSVEAWAAFSLWAATGRVYGPCPVSVFPCAEGYCAGCQSPLRLCGCSSVSVVRLDGPVDEVTAVVIDGVSLSTDAYWVEDYIYLVRLDGGTWPASVDPTDFDGFRVDYNLGRPPPDGAGLVTGILACEFAKAICNDDTCRLPNRLRTVTRQGLSVTTGRNLLIDEFNLTGIPEVDTWIQNVRTPMLAGAVHTPDLPSPRRVTWRATS